MRAEPIIVHGCHCRFCQRMTGSPLAVNVMVETAELDFLTDGRPDAVQTPSALPAGQVFLRCPRCRCVLWAHHSQLGEAIALINAGAFDRAEAFVPDVHCYTASRHSWIALPPGVPAFEADYDSGAVWSDDAKARIARALSPQG